MKVIRLTLAFLTIITICSLLQAKDLSSNKFPYSQRNNIYKTGEIGVGLQVGSLSGINLDYWINENRSINGAVSFNYGQTIFSVAHLWMQKDVFAKEPNLHLPSSFVPYIGLGAMTSFGTNAAYYARHAENFSLAVQVPLGIQFLPIHQQFSIFGELAPSLELSPYGIGFVTADLGAKFYF